MGQKVAIRRVDVRGASPFLGLFDTGKVDSDGNPVKAPRWSRNGDDIMNWLCNAHRFRFNQLRSRRSRWRESAGAAPGEGGERVRELVPLGRYVDNRSEKQTRAEVDFMASVPGMVSGHPTGAEPLEWSRAIAIRRTRRAKGQKPGAMPGFRSRTKGQKFGCWHANGRNAVFEKTGRRSGIVVIRGRNAAANCRPGEGLGTYFQIRIHVRVSQPIRPYSSIEVNWDERTLVFVNLPPERAEPPQPGRAVGIDAGVVHAFATSDGRFFDLPAERLRELESLRRQHQRRMDRSRRVAAAQGRRFWESNRYQREKAHALRLTRRIKAIREDFWDKTSAELVRDYEFLAVEDLRLMSMSARRRGAGAVRKRGLNRSLRSAALGTGREKLAYKARLAGRVMLSVRPHYSSQECAECGHVDPLNRVDQATFRCQRCGHTANADTNAARVLLARGREAWESMDEGERKKLRDGPSRAGSRPRWGRSRGLPGSREADEAGPAAAVNREPVGA